MKINLIYSSFIRPLLFKALEELRALPHAYFFRRPLLALLVAYALVLAGARNLGYLGRASAHDIARFSGQRGAVVGVVTGHPDARPTGVVYTVRTEMIEIWDTGERTVAQGRLLIQTSGSSLPAATPGDRIRALGRLQRPRGALVPGGFDYAGYLADHGIHALLYTGARSFENLGPTSTHRVSRLGWSLKSILTGIFQKRLESGEATVLSGLVAGVRPRFHPEIRRWFTESGTMHVLVASGSNVAYVTALWFLAMTILFRLPRMIAVASALPVVGLYVALVGADAPILRAGLMAAMAAASYLLRRNDHPLHAVAAAALLILIVDPLSLFDAGFQMSFVTVAGMMLLLPDLQLSEPQQKAGPLRWLGQLVLITVTAQIWLFPLSASLFHQFAPGGLAANLIAVPMAALGLSAGFALAAVDRLAFVFPLAEGTAQAIAVLVNDYLSFLIRLVRFFAEHVPLVWLRPFTGIQTTGFYLACLCLAGTKRSVLCRGGVIAGTALVLLGMEPKPSTPAVTWLNAGGGALAIVEDGQGSAAVLHAERIGDREDAERRLRPYLATRGIHHVTILDTGAFSHQPDHEEIRRDLRASVLPFRAHQPFTLGPVTVSLLVDQEREEAHAFVVRVTSQTAVLAPFLSLDLQRRLLDQRHVDVLATRFSPRLLWAPAFVQRFKPRAVEIGRSSAVEAFVPWNTEPVRIAKEGWWRYTFPQITSPETYREMELPDAGSCCGLPSAKDLDEKKSGGKAARVRPPGHASHLAPDRRRRE